MYNINRRGLGGGGVRAFGLSTSGPWGLGFRCLVIYIVGLGGISG